MKERAGERYLTWAFGIALLLHGVALTVAARLPAASAREGSFDQITVFSESAPPVVSPVDLVEWPLSSALTTTLGIPQPAAPAATSRLTVTGHPAPRPRPAAAARAATRAPGAGRTAGGGRPVSRTAAPAGGGGGGPVDLGSPSPGGELPGLVGGQTPVGAVPGDGGGSGPGAGPGSGGATGGGSGGGAGPGEGSGAGVGPGGGGGSGAGTGGGFVSRVAERVEPQLLRKTAPDYPASAVEDGVEGVVKLKVLVTETGSVAEVEVTASSGDRRLDAAARECVRKWLYRPAIQDGKPRRVHTHATVEFELR